MQYQNQARRFGTQARIHTITPSISSSANSALDIGCNEGLISNRLADLGLQVTGIEQNVQSITSARQFAECNHNNITFLEKKISIEDLESFPDADVILFLSVHHQIVASEGIDYANRFLKKLVEKAKLQVFFEPCAIHKKYGTEMPFIENNVESIKFYFEKILQKLNVELTFLGCFENRIPPHEPFRPLFVINKRSSINPIVIPSIKDGKVLSNITTNLIHVPIEDILHNFQSFSQSGYHYMAETCDFIQSLLQLGFDRIDYKQTPLFAYYQNCQPKQMSDILRIHKIHTDCGVYQNQPVGYYCDWSPWNSNNQDFPQDMQYGRTRYNKWPDWDSHRYGPVAGNIGTKEIQRIYKLYIDFSQLGYQPELNHDGYVRGIILKSGSQTKFLLTAGAHRLAVLKTLGYHTLLAKFQPNQSRIIDIDQSGDWPLVRQGIYNQEQAKNIFNAIFYSTGAELK